MQYVVPLQDGNLNAHAIESSASLVCRKMHYFTDKRLLMFIHVQLLKLEVSTQDKNLLNNDTNLKQQIFDKQILTYNHNSWADTKHSN